MTRIDKAPEEPSADEWSLWISDFKPGTAYLAVRIAEAMEQYADTQVGIARSEARAAIADAYRMGQEAAEAKLRAIHPILRRLAHADEENGGMPYFGMAGQRTAIKEALDLIGPIERDSDD